MGVAPIPGMPLSSILYHPIYIREVRGVEASIAPPSAAITHYERDLRVSWTRSPAVQSYFTALLRSTRVSRRRSRDEDTVEGGFENVCVRTFTGRNHVFLMPRSSPLGAIFETIHQEIGVPIEQQRLIWNGRHLSADPIEESSIRNVGQLADMSSQGSVDNPILLHLVLRLRGGIADRVTATFSIRRHEEFVEEVVVPYTTLTVQIEGKDAAIHFLEVRNELRRLRLVNPSQYLTVRRIPVWARGVPSGSLTNIVCWHPHEIRLALRAMHRLRLPRELREHIAWFMGIEEGQWLFQRQRPGAADSDGSYVLPPCQSYTIEDNILPEADTPSDEDVSRMLDDGTWSLYTDTMEVGSITVTLHYDERTFPPGLREDPVGLLHIAVDQNFICDQKLGCCVAWKNLPLAALGSHISGNDDGYRIEQFRCATV